MRGLVALAAVGVGVAGASLLAGEGGVSNVSRISVVRHVDALAQLPLAAQGPVSAALGASDSAYWVRGLSAANPEQGLRMRFGAGGVTVATAGGLVRFGGLAGAPVVRRNRVTYSAGGVKEWWANGPIGLEQGYTVARGPASGRIHLSLSLGGDLRPRLAGGALLLGDSLRYSGLVAVDARGRSLPAALSLHGHRVTLTVRTNGARYPFKVDPWVQSANLNEPSPAPSDAFGRSSVAVSGNTIVVGAAAHKVDSNPSQGAVFVFTKPSTGWADSTASTMLTASDGGANDELGASVATNGTTIVASSQYHGASGAVYVFVAHNGSWGPHETTELTAPGSPPKGGYMPVAISPDDDTIAFGQPDTVVNTNIEQGEAFAFTKPAGGWGAPAPKVATLMASDGAANDVFGLELAASDNTIAVIGGITGGGSADTAAYVFVKGAGGWATGSQTAELSDSSSPIEPDGSSTLSVSPDGKTVVVGNTNNLSVPDGDAVVFAEGAGGWHDSTAPSATLTASDGAQADAFGFATAATNNTIVVGAPQHTVNHAPNIGAIYIFDEPAGGWSGSLHETQEVNPNTTTKGAAGSSLGFDGFTIAAGSYAMEEGAWVFTNPDITTTGGGPSGPPVNTVKPAVSGAARSGGNLTCSTGTWTNSPTGYTYQWTLGGSAIAGATGATYTVQSIDEGLSLSCTVIASNGKGSGAPATSNGVAIPVPSRKNCPAATGKLTGTGMGLLKLGMTRAQARHVYSKSSTRGRGYVDFFCLTPRGIRDGYGSTKLPKAYRGRVIWISTALAFYAVHGVRVTESVAAAGRVLKLTGPFKVGKNEWYFAPNGASHAIFKVRRGVIDEVGIADKALTTGRSAERRFLMSFS